MTQKIIVSSMKRFLFALLLASAGFMGALGLARIAHAESSSFILLSSYYLLPGQSLTVSGFGFSPNSSVSVNAFGTTTAAAANGSGQFTSQSLTVPFSAINSTVQISANGAQGGSGTANLVVGTFYPVVNPSSYYVLPGGTVSFNGTNFAPNEIVIIQRNGVTVATSTADGGGNFSTGAIPVGFSSGNAVFNFVGQTSGVSTQRTITVAALNPFILLSTYFAPVGSPLTINGKQFGINEIVSVSFAGTTLGTATTNGNGEFTFNTTVPAASAGNQAVSARGLSTGATATANFTVAPSAPSANPAVSIVSVDRIKENVPQGQSTTITARLISSNASANDVTIRVDLFNQSGQLVNEALYAHETLPQDVIHNYQLITSPYLPAGDYRIAILVSGSGGAELLSQSNAGTIAIR